MTAASNNSATPMDDGHIPGTLQFLRIRDVCQMLRISKPTLWRLRRSPDFPVPTQLSDRAIGWSRDDIQAWVATRRHSPSGRTSGPGEGPAQHRVRSEKSDARLTGLTQK